MVPREQSDEVEEMFRAAGGEDLEFDANELEQIEMLEKYRSKLVAEAELPASQGAADEPKDEKGVE